MARLAQEFGMRLLHMPTRNAGQRQRAQFLRIDEHARLGDRVRDQFFGATHASDLRGGVRHVHDQGLGHRQQMPIPDMLEQCVAEHADRDARSPGRGMRAEQGRPVMRIPDRQQVRIGEPDDRARLVEMGQRALPTRAAFRSDTRDVGNLTRIQCAFEQRMTQPRERVEQIVCVVLARREHVRLCDAFFVVQMIGEQCGVLRKKARTRNRVDRLGAHARSFERGHVDAVGTIDQVGVVRPCT
jgi:hypothetical protein